MTLQLRTPDIWRDFGATVRVLRSNTTLVLGSRRRFFVMRLQAHVTSNKATLPLRLA